MTSLTKYTITKDKMMVIPFSALFHSMPPMKKYREFHWNVPFHQRFCPPLSPLSLSLPSVFHRPFKLAHTAHIQLCERIFITHNNGNLILNIMSNTFFCLHEYSIWPIQYLFPIIQHYNLKKLNYTVFVFGASTSNVRYCRLFCYRCCGSAISIQNALTHTLAPCKMHVYCSWWEINGRWPAVFVVVVSVILFPLLLLQLFLVVSPNCFSFPVEILSQPFATK